MKNDGFKEINIFVYMQKKKKKQWKKTKYKCVSKLQFESLGKTFEDVNASSALSGGHLMGVSFPQKLKSPMRENSKEEYTHNHTQNHINSEKSGNKNPNVHIKWIYRFVDLSLAFKIKKKQQPCNV